MRPGLHLIASLMVGLVSTLSLIAPGSVNPMIDRLVPDVVRDLAGPQVKPADALKCSTPSPWEPIGLSMLGPYVRGKIPAVLIHGLGATPDSWEPMIERLNANPLIRNHYQFWTFGYATGQPILYSASLLRQALQEAREHFDPAKTDRAFDQMVLIGYSMGGILAKAMAQDSQSVLWDQISDQPVDKLAGPADARDTLRQAFFFKAVPEVHRIIFIATPHRGSRVDSGALHWLALQLNPTLDSLRKIHGALVASNAPEYFREPFRERLASSVDQLAWEHPMLMAMNNLGLNPAIKVHSIIADLNDPPSPGGSDGVVSYASSHLDKASSELIVRGGHLCLANPAVISECERILAENLAVPGRRSGRTGPRTDDNGVKSLSGSGPVSGRPGQPDPARAPRRAVVQPA
jgi:pimeloyl-ACP methyl ester carboxylesterase